MALLSKNSGLKSVTGWIIGGVIQELEYQGDKSQQSVKHFKR
jgi:hypothetical protein